MSSHRTCNKSNVVLHARVVVGADPYHEEKRLPHKPVGATIGRPFKRSPQTAFGAQNKRFAETKAFPCQGRWQPLG